MFPRLAVFISPKDAAAGLYHVRVRKGWWGGPGKGGTSREILDLVVTLKADSDAARVREALRAAADAIEG